MRLSTYSKLAIIVTVLLIVAIVVCYGHWKPLKILGAGLQGEQSPTSYPYSEKLNRLENFDTGLNLGKINFKSGLSLPHGIALVKDDYKGFERYVYLQKQHTEEGFQLLIRADGFLKLSVGSANIYEAQPTTKKAMRGSFPTALGIAIGAKPADVIAKYGETKPRVDTKRPEMEYVVYKGKPGGSYESLLAFTFKDGILIQMDFMYFSPKGIEKWHKAKHEYELKDGKLVLKD